MPVPKYRTSASKRNMRRSHHALKAPGLSICPKCQDVKRSHTACSACGFYGDNKAFEVKTEAKEWQGEGLDENPSKS